MPVTREQLAEYVKELGLPQEQSDSLITTLMSNDAAATQFVGQRMRHSDYTRKTQELADQRKHIESEAANQITQYAQELAQAQAKINTIMSDLEKEQISAATANARLQKVKTTYNLSDADIPAVEGVTKPAGTADPGKQGTVDIDARLDKFQKDILKTIRQDLMAMPQITAIQADIAADHLELTGKRLTRNEMSALLKHAEDNKIRLEDAWRQKYDIDNLRTAKSDETKKAQWKKEWEEEQRAKASDAALAGVRPQTQSRESFQSPVLRKQFQDQSDPARQAPVADKSPAPQPVPQQGPKLSGAERAAAKFLERRNQGIPLGAAAPAN